MLKPETIKRERRRLRALLDSDTLARNQERYAYGMETALTWILGGCTWRPSTLIGEVE